MCSDRGLSDGKFIFCDLRNPLVIVFKCILAISQIGYR